MKRKKGDGVPELRGKAMWWAFGRLSKVGGRGSTTGLVLGWEMAGGCGEEPLVVVFLEFFSIAIDGNRLGKLVARIQGSQDR